MKDMYSFLVFFHLLDKCYEECKDVDFACFLSSSSPELWGGGKPVDIAIYEDWVEFASGKATMKNIVQTHMGNDMDSIILER